MSLYSEIVSDQLPAAISAVRSHLAKWSPSQLARIVFTEFIAFLRKYWAWAMYFIILRKLYRILSRTNKRSSKPNRIKRSSASVPDSNNTIADLVSTPCTVDVASLTDTAEYVPSKNQMIVGDGVIVINRNDRYVEVYERKNVAKVGSVEAEVKALLKEFAARNDK
ncbi:hypothetical protein LMJF_30_1750 [Leishmania major strain Friedlin]|uniref:Uncharacterized protein n=1 Tax=Leishmania major TaxID=5664 RepID=Q4Q7B9_LEIMA|nr:hypothetical protein LMJF_30_1750 [Leishmania major strain Friedlin]CAG9578408.1 hypothetical_protein_-_conserved [Leishmania major strain Friedlin]CAJ06316.1 hypothetical protein LMJF_30_1750 [Leishmania major strain Friedlin]|eukprot:XP_001684779.1 hypothetical protein LMJF_30_1750 [Leishmania major strain Friedlin]